MDDTPFLDLGGLAGKVVTDAWTTAMLAVWDAGLWVLRLVLRITDVLLVPDLSEDGPGAWLYQVTFWIAATLLLIMAMIQLGVAVMRRDGKSLARVAIGFGQFVVVWAGWIAYGVTVVAASNGLAHALMQGLLNVTSWSAWQPWEPFTPSDITDAAVATVLGLMGLLLWIAAIGHFLVMLTRSASLMVLMATTPIAAAGLVSDAGRAWFWKSLRWFHAAALAPALMTMVMGVGIQFTTGVANGLTGVQGAVGTAVPGVILICIAVVSPLALFKLLSFVDPNTTSGAALRSTLAANGGIQGFLSNRSGGSNTATVTDAAGRSSGEAGAEAATTERFTAAGTTGGGAAATGTTTGAAATAGGGAALGAAAGVVAPAAAVLGLAAAGMGLINGIGVRGANLGTDLTNQMGVGHNTYPPDFTPAARRATYAAQAASAGDPYGPGDGGGGPTVGGSGDYQTGFSYPGTGPSYQGADYEPTHEAPPPLMATPSSAIPTEPQETP